MCPESRYDPTVRNELAPGGTGAMFEDGTHLGLAALASQTNDPAPKYPLRAPNHNMILHNHPAEGNGRASARTLGPPRDEILARLDVAAEFRELGIVFHQDSPDADGWQVCHAIGEDQKTPSAAINVVSGAYRDAKSGTKSSLFDLAKDCGKVRSIGEAFAYYADRANLTASRPKAPQRPKRPSMGYPTLDAAVEQIRSGLAFQHKPAEVSVALADDYTDANGNVVVHIVRFEVEGRDKEIRPFRKCDDGKWRPEQAPAPRPMLNLPEILEHDGPVWLVEGELCARVVKSLGLVGTTCCGGSKATVKTDWSPLAHRDLIILPDNDGPGRAYAEDVLAILHGLGSEGRYKLVELPGLGEGDDVADWVPKGDLDGPRARLLRERLEALAEAVPWADVVPKTIPIRPSYRDECPPIRTDLQGDALDAHLAQFDRTDLGNAHRLVTRHGDALRYCAAWESWLSWDGKRWASDTTEEARRRAHHTARKMLAEAGTIGDRDEAEAAARFAFGSQSSGRITAMLRESQVYGPIPVTPDVLDADPWALNVANGVVDLRTGILEPHDKSRHFTKLCALDYDPKAACPLWEATLAKFFARPDPADQAELIRYFQKLAGYSVTGVIRDHVLPVAYGRGSNGKSTLLGTLLDVLGTDYAMKSPPDLLMARHNDAHPTERADLFGRRLVVAIESEENRRLNESLVKELTGGDRIRARRMRENFWEFSPTHKLWLATNHRPEVRGTDHGIWRRLKLIPFTVTLADDQADKSVPERLKAEYPGILAWIVRGCLAWQSEGLAEPREVREATDAYRREEDVIGGFLEERTIRNNAVRVKASQLYASYADWAKAGNQAVLSQTKFGRCMAERGFQSTRSGGIWYLGIGILVDQDVPSDSSEF